MFNYISKISIFIFIKKNFIYLYCLIFLITFITSIFLQYYFNLFYNREYPFSFFSNQNEFEEGLDGLTYLTCSKNLYLSFLNLDIKEFLRGCEDIYYFMPGQKYLLFLNKLFFGDFFILIYILILIQPLLIFKIINLHINPKISFTICLCFIFGLPFEYIGFSYPHHFFWSTKLYGDTVAISLYLCAILLLNSNKYSLTSLILLFFTAFIRPNYLPACLIVYFVNFLFSISLKSFIYNLFGICTFALFPLHNYFYYYRDPTSTITYIEGSIDKFYIITRSTDMAIVNKISISDYINLIFNFDYQTFDKIKIHVLNHLFDKPFFILNILLLLLYLSSIIRLKKKEKIFYFLFFSAFFQHLVLFVYINEFRYGIFAWMLTCLTVIIFISRYLKTPNLLRF